MKSKLLRNGAIYGAANAISAAVPFLLLPVLTRALSPTDYGRVISFFMLVSLSTALAGLSVHGAVGVKWFQRQTCDFPRFVGTAVSLAALSTLLCGLVLLAAAHLFQASLDLEPRFWFLAAAQSGATVVLGVRTALWQSQGRALNAASLQIVAAVANVGLSLAAVFALGLGGDGRIYGSVTASLACAVLGVWFLARQHDARWSADARDMRDLLRFGVPLIPHAVAGGLMVTADRFSVASILGTDQLGIYGTAGQLGMVLVVLGDAANKALSPWFYAQMALQSTRARLRVVGAAYLLLPTWLLIAIASWLFLKVAGGILIGQRYLPAIDLSIWFLLGGALSASYLNIVNLFFFTSKTEWLSVATVASATVAVLLDPALARHFGLIGAAASYLCVQAVSLLLFWALSTKVKPMPWGSPMLAIRLLRNASTGARTAGTAA